MNNLNSYFASPVFLQRYALGGEDVRVHQFSKDQMITDIPDIQDLATGEPKTETKKGGGYGREGFVWKFTNLIEYGFKCAVTDNPTSKAVSKILSVLRNKYPYTNTTLGWSGFPENKSHWLQHYIDRSNDLIVRSVLTSEVFIDGDPTKTPLSDAESFELTGTAKRTVKTIDQYPIFLEGWGFSGTVTPSATPDNKAVVGAGHGWARRGTGTYVPKHFYFPTATNSATFGVVTADSRIDSLVIYLSANGTPTLLKVVGTQGASPTAPSDSDIDTAVDAVLTGALWVRVADVTVTETTTVVIATADIDTSILSGATLTRTFTAIAHGETKDSYYPFTYSLVVYVNGLVATSSIGYTDGGTTIVVPTSVSGAIHVAYLCAPYDKDLDTQANVPS